MNPIEQRYAFPTTRGSFHIFDASAERDTSGMWTLEALARRLMVLPGVIGVGTVETFAQVAVTLRIQESEPEASETERWAFVSECSVEITSGRLRVAPRSDYAGPALPLVMLAPGRYRARVACDRGPDAPVLPGGVELYRVVLWPAPSGA
jgi:hypothetical protein